MKYEKGSFITIPNQKLLKGLTPIAQTVFIWLCFHANQDGECFPSLATISKEAGIGKTAVKKAILILSNNGLIEKENRKEGKKNMTNLYQIIIGGVGREATEGVGREATYLGREATEGVGRQVAGELNPLSLTQSTKEETLKKKTEKFIKDLKKTMSGIPIKTGQIEQMKDFVLYWTEPDKNWEKQKDPKIRYDHEETWDMKRRVAKWFRNSKNFNKSSDNKYQVKL